MEHVALKQLVVLGELIMFATVGLRISDFVDRALCIDGFSHGFRHRWIGVEAMTMTHGHGERQYTMKSAYLPLLALQLLFSRFISFRAIASFSSLPPLHSCMFRTTAELTHL